MIQKFKNSKIYKSVAGQMLVIFAMTWLIFAGGMFSVYNIGTLVGERIKIQNTADAAAFTGAVWEARTLNYIAYTNRTIIAELSFIAYLCALCSCVDAWKTLCSYAKAIPYVGYIFAAIEAVLNVIKNILDTIIDLPWELLPQGIGLLQSAMEAFMTIKITQSMDEVAKKSDSNISINSGIYNIAEIINKANHFALFDPDNGAVRRKGQWEGLLKVLNETIGSYTKGSFNGALPIYNRSFSISIPILVVKIAIGIYGDVDITKQRIKTSDGPGVALYYWDFWDWEWEEWESVSWGMFTKEKDINLDQIRFYDYNHKNNQSVGIYAVATKPANKISSMIYQKFNNMFGVPSTDLKAISKAIARYDDPDRSSDRHNALKGGDTDEYDKENKDNDWEPNLFNPFWKAELVSLTGKDTEDYNATVSTTTLIRPAVGLFESFWVKEH